MYYKIGVLLYLLVFHLIFVNHSVAQDINTPFHQRIDLTNKMPSDVVYELAQNKKGTIWLASEKGLFSYSGFFFTAYQIEKSNNYTNDVIGVQIDYLNRPIALDFSKYLLLVDNEEIIHKKKGNSVPQLASYSYKVLNFSTYSLITDGISIYKLQDRLFTKISALNPVVEFPIQDFYKENNNLILYYSNGQKLVYDIIARKIIENTKGNGGVLNTLALNNKLISCTKTAIIIKDEKGSTTFNTPVNQNIDVKPAYFYTQKKGSLVYGVVSSYLFILNCKETKPTIKWYFIGDASTLSSVLVSNDGTVHISTLGDGMYRIYPEWLNTEHVTNNTTSKILYYSKVADMEVAIQKRRIYLYKNGALYKSMAVRDDVLITQVTYLKGYYYASGFHFLFKVPKSDFENLSEFNYATLAQYKFTTKGCKDIAVFYDKLYYTTAHNLVRYNPDLGFRDTLINQRCEKIFIQNNLLFVNTENHLKIFNSRGTNLFNLNIRANAVTSKDSNSLFVLSKTNDLFLLNLSSQKLISIKTKLNKGIDDILWFKNYLYICNSNGINRLNYFAHNYTTSVVGTYEFSHYDMELLSQGGKCVLSSNRGVIVTNITDFFSRKYRPTYLAIESATGNKKDNTIYLGKMFNHLTVNVVDENLASTRFLVLVGGDSSYYSTSSIQLGLLPEGRSDVSIVGYDRFGNATKPLNFRVSNTYPFFSSRLFTNLLIGTVVSLLLLMLYSVYNYQRKLWDIEAKTKNKEMETRLVALRSQMNPHFIYNVLNTAQSHMFSNDIASANNIITKLSNIIREVLESTKTRYVEIGEEIKLISEYCELEKARYDDKFNFEIIVADNVNKKLKIPYFFVQPLVENAIWHGLIKDVQNNDRKLRVTFAQDDKTIVITVDDNGVGYDIAKVRNGSVALNNLKERIEIKKQLRKIDSSLHIYNKKELNINDKGTICKLTILMPDFI
jgi:hypothetical protein